MHAREPSSDLWDWPMTRTGQAAMALLALAIIVPLVTPLAMMIFPFGQDDESILGWIVVPLLIAGGLGLLSGILALVAMTVQRERSLYLGFAVLGALLVVLLIV